MSPRPRAVTLPLPPGADPQFRYPRPDVEQLVHRTIRDLGGVQVWAYAMVDLDPAWICAASLQVDVRATNKGECYRRADEARRAIMCLPLAAWPDGQVNRVDVIDGPFWLPDPSGGPRYVARYRIVFHPLAAPRRDDSE